MDYKNRKVAVFNYREFDELPFLREAAEEFGLELQLIPTSPTKESIELMENCSCANIITTPTDASLLEKMKDKGIGYVTTRTIGYDHIDMQAAKELGIKIGNAPYGPEGVADYTVMLMLMCLRKAKSILKRGENQDFTLPNLMGREMKDLTVGIIGTGRIGSRVIQNLKGFDCEIIAYDLFKKPESELGASYVSLEEIWKRSDIISLHMPLFEENRHMINKETIAAMKEQVILINTARGGLICEEDLLEGLYSGKIAAAGLDVVEEESQLYYHDKKEAILHDRNFHLLRSFSNVIVTHHMAFYTDNAVRTMARDSLYSCSLELDGKKNPWRVDR